MTPPPSDNTPSVIHKVRLFHRDIYTIGHKLAKRHKLGIHQKIEGVTLELLSLLIEAAFSPPTAKVKVLESARVKQSVVQNLVRMEYELEIINGNTYLKLSKFLVGIGKEISNWINFLTQKTTQKGA